MVAPLPPPLHEPEGDVRQVLHPLEVTDDNTASIDIEIGKDRHSAGAEDLVRFEGDRAVGGFDDEMCLDALRVFSMNSGFHRRWNQNVARLFDAVHIAGKNGEAFRIGDIPVTFSNNGHRAPSSSDKNLAA